MRVQVTPNFYLDEFIDPYTYFNRADHGRSLMDERIFPIAQQLRDYKGESISINNWWNKYKEMEGSYPLGDIISFIENSNLHKWSGFRSSRCTIGSSQSAHKLGKAIDPKGNQFELYNIVKDNANVFYAMGLRRLEDPNITNGWLHIDTLERNTQPNKIRIVGLTSHVGDINV